MRLFYVSSLENFNTIFSLEYILPPKVFEKLYNYKVTKYDIEKEFITLYKILPPIDKDEFIIELCIDYKDTINITENIIITPYILCLKAKKIIFENEDMKKIYIGRSLLVSEIKNTEYYIDIFMTMNEVKKNLISTKLVLIKSKNQENTLLDFQTRKIILYDKLLGGLYYASYINNSSLVITKQVYENYSKKIQLNKIMDQLKDINLLLRNTKSGLMKDIDNLKLKLSISIKHRKSTLIKVSKDLKISLNRNHKFDFKGKDLIILNKIIINLLEEKNNIEEKMKNIGEDIKEINFIDNKVIEEYRMIYDICINGNLSYDIENIETEVLKCFLISMLKKDNLKEAQELANKHYIKSNIYIYFLMGLIKGYSGMSKLIKRDVDTDDIAKLLILKELGDIKNRLDNFYKIKLYKVIIDLKKSNNIFKIRNKNIYGEPLPMKLKSRTSKDLNFIFEINENTYTITLYKYLVKGYIEEIKQLKLRTNNNGEYKNFRIKKQCNNKLNSTSKKLNELDYYHLYKVLIRYKKEN